MMLGFLLRSLICLGKTNENPYFNCNYGLPQSEPH